MYSREEAAKIRKEFWVSYGKSFPRKWILYNTKIKNLGFKFVANRKQAMVVLDIESSDNIQRELLFEQLVSLKKILETEYLPNVIYDKDYFLDNGKSISRIYVEHNLKFSIHNKNTWAECYAFFNEAMHQFELFWYEFQDYIKQAVV